MLTEKMKAVALKGWNDGMGMFPMGVYAAVEAVLAEQPRAAEQGQQGVMTVTYKEPCKQPCTRWVYKEDSGPLCDDCGAPLPKDKQPAHPLAGDVVEAARNAWMICADYPASPERFRKFILPAVDATLAVARDGWVSRDSLRDLLDERDAEWEQRLSEFRMALHNSGLHGHYNLFQNHFAEPMGEWVRNRLAKPAERVTDGVTWSQLANGNALVRLDGVDVATFYRGPYSPKHVHDCAERYAAGLRQELRESREGGKQ